MNDNNVSGDFNFKPPIFARKQISAQVANVLYKSKKPQEKDIDTDTEIICSGSFEADNLPLDDPLISNMYLDGLKYKPCDILEIFKQNNKSYKIEFKNQKKLKEKSTKPAFKTILKCSNLGLIYEAASDDKIEAMNFAAQQFLKNVHPEFNKWSELVEYYEEQLNK